MAESVKSLSTLTLTAAIKADLLHEFVLQEESRGIGPADTGAFTAIVSRAAKRPQLADQTSRSASGDGSSEKVNSPR